MHQQEKNIKGFNILELLVVLSIISIISAVAYPNFSSWRKERIIRAAAIEIKNLLENTSSQVQRGSYGFAQVQFSEAAGSVSAISRGMKNDKLLSKIRDGESSWYGQADLRCRMDIDDGFTIDPDDTSDPPGAYWDHDGSVNVDDDSENDLVQVNIKEYDNIALSFSGVTGAICFSADGTWYAGNGPLAATNALYICNQSLERNQCGIDDDGAPNAEHENLYEISWTRFGGIAIQKWIGDRWALQ